MPAGDGLTWSTGAVTPSITVKDPGTYWVKAYNGTCIGSDTIKVAQKTLPSVSLGRDTLLCNGNVLQLSAGADTVLWSTGVKGNSITVAQGGAYWAIATNVCGSVTDTVHVNYEACNIWFPTAFTPNNDGLNDLAGVHGSLSAFTNFSLSIFNRWGQKVFYSEDIYSGWDGNYNGAKAEMGTYFYMIYYTLEGSSHMLKGDLTLLR